jgi:hypothetical protein
VVPCMAVTDETLPGGGQWAFGMNLSLENLKELEFEMELCTHKLR